MSYKSDKHVQSFSAYYSLVQLFITPCAFDCDSKLTRIHQAHIQAFSSGAFLAAAVWGGQRGGQICIWGQEFRMT